MCALCHLAAEFIYQGMALACQSLVVCAYVVSPSAAVSMVTDPGLDAVLDVQQSWLKSGWFSTVSFSSVYWREGEDVRMEMESSTPGL